MAGVVVVETMDVAEVVVSVAVAVAVVMVVVGEPVVEVESVALFVVKQAVVVSLIEFGHSCCLVQVQVLRDERRLWLFGEDPLVACFELANAVF